MAVSAASIWLIELVALVPSVPAIPDPAVAPSALPRALVIDVVPDQSKPATEIWSSVVLVLAPIWKVEVAEEARMLVPLNCVPAIVRLASSASCVYSWFRLSRSTEELVPLAACTASSRMRWSMLVTLPSAPSAVCASEIAVVGVAHRDVHAARLGVHAGGDGQAGGVVLGAVDTQARGQALHRGRQRRLAGGQVALGVQGDQIRVDRHGHGSSPIGCGPQATA